MLDSSPSPNDETNTTAIISESDSAVKDIIIEKIQSLKSQAEAIVADYWVWVEESNEALRLEKKIGNRIKEKSISFGPRVEKVQSGRYVKYVPNWVHYPFDERKSKHAQIAKRGLRVKLGGNKEYSLKTLLKFATGADDSKIVSTERKLMVLREKIEMYHVMLVSFGRRETRIERILGKYEGGSNDE